MTMLRTARRCAFVAAALMLWLAPSAQAGITSPANGGVYPISDDQVHILIPTTWSYSNPDGCKNEPHVTYYETEPGREERIRSGGGLDKNDGAVLSYVYTGSYAARTEFTCIMEGPTPSTGDDFVASGPLESINFMVVKAGQTLPGPLPSPPPAGPELNKCLQVNAWFQTPEQRRELGILEQQLRAAAAGLKEAGQALDLAYQFLKGFGELGKNVSDTLEKAEKILDSAERAVKNVQANEQRIQRDLNQVTKTLKGGVKMSDRPALEKRQRELKQQLIEATKNKKTAQQTLGQLKQNKVHELVRALRRYPQLKELRKALRNLDEQSRKAREFLKKNPAASGVMKGLGQINFASNLSTYSAWAAEMLANLLREMRRPPAGCPELFEKPLPPSVESGTAVATRSAAVPAFEPLPAPVADLPPSLTGRTPPAVATSLKRQLAEITALIPAVHVGLLQRDNNAAARAALKRTLPRLRTLLARTGALRPKLANALQIKPRAISPRDASRYRPQAPSRAALRLLAQGAAPGWLRASFQSVYREGFPPSGLQDPLSVIADPALGQLEADVAEALGAVR